MGLAWTSRALYFISSSTSSILKAVRLLVTAARIGKQLRHIGIFFVFLPNLILICSFSNLALHDNDTSHFLHGAVSLCLIWAVPVRFQYMALNEVFPILLTLLLRLSFHGEIDWRSA